MDIYSRYDSEKIIYSSKKETIKEVLEEANLKGANLKGANLEGANLKGAKTRYTVVNFSKEEYEIAKVFIEGLLIN